MWNENMKIEINDEYMEKTNNRTAVEWNINCWIYFSIVFIIAWCFITYCVGFTEAKYDTFPLLNS